MNYCNFEVIPWLLGTTLDFAVPVPDFAVPPHDFAVRAYDLGHLLVPREMLCGMPLLVTLAQEMASVTGASRVAKQQRVYLKNYFTTADPVDWQENMLRPRY